MKKSDIKYILQRVNQNKLSVNEALELITKKEIKKKNDVIKDTYLETIACHFQGRNGTDYGRCSRVSDTAKKRGDCSTCRVAAEWEEAYG